MSSINRATIMGNVGKDPVVRDVNGTTVASFTIATTDRWKDKETGEKVERTEWHNIQAWAGTASIVERFVRKGSHVLVEGKIRTRKYTNKEGVTVYSTEINADEVYLLGKRDATAPLDTTPPTTE